MEREEWDNIEVVKASLGQCSKIESLLQRANITPEENDEIHRNYIDYSEDQANEVIEYLAANQVDMVEGGFNYTQTYLKWKLRQL